MLKSNKSFYYLRRRAAPGIVEAVNALGEPGIALEREPDRLYPQTSLAAHVVGYTDVDGKGVAGIERALNDQLSDSGEPRPSGPTVDLQPHPAGDGARAPVRHDQILGQGRRGRDHGHPYRRSPGADVAAAAQSQCCRAGLSRSALQPRDAGRLGAWVDLQAVHGRDGHGQRASSRASARCTSARTTFTAYGKVIHDTHPYGRACSVAEIMKESSNIGSAQIADQVGATRQRAFLDKMGFLERSRNRTSGEGAAVDCPARLGSVGRHDGRLRPRPRGQPAPSRQRLCDLVQRRHLSPADDPQGRQGPCRSARAVASSPRKRATRCARCCGWS